MRYLWSFICVLLLASLPAQAANRSLTILTEEYPPISFARDGMLTGMAVDVVREIQRRVGNQDDIQLQPWLRAYRSLQEQPDTVLFTVARTAEREKQFKWVGPIAPINGGIYAVRSHWTGPNNLDEARKAKSILVVRGWFTQQQLEYMGFTNLYPVNDPPQMAKMMRNGRAPLMATDTATAALQWLQAGGKPDELLLVEVFSHNSSYIAFNRATPDTVVQAWQAALDAMKKDGSYSEIFSRWLPELPQP